MAFRYNNTEEMETQNITIKVIAPDTTQLMRSARAIESICNPVYIEGKVFRNDRGKGAHLFLTLPINWFREHEQKMVLEENAIAEPSREEQPCKATTTPLNFGLTEVNSK